MEFLNLSYIYNLNNKRMKYKSYFQTTPMTDEQLISAIKSAKDQENKVFLLFKKYGSMTTWDVYDTYNHYIGPIIPSSIGRSVNTLIKLNVISSIGTVNGDQGRPCNLYCLNEDLPEVIERRQTGEVPKSIKLNLVFTEDGTIDIEQMVNELDLLLLKISKKFKLKY